MPPPVTPPNTSAAIGAAMSAESTPQIDPATSATTTPEIPAARQPDRHRGEADSEPDEEREPGPADDRVAGRAGLEQRRGTVPSAPGWAPSVAHRSR